MGKFKLGRDFVDELLLAIIAGNLRIAPDEDPWPMIKNRLTACRKLLFDLPGTAGRPNENDDRELYAMGNEYWAAKDLPAEVDASALSIDDELIREIARVVGKETPYATKTSREKTLASKFRQEFYRIMTIIADDLYEENKADYGDLDIIREIFERRGYGFDMYGNHARKQSEAVAKNRKKKPR